jgi:branched-chain amino acid transport system permease protein
VLMPLAFVLLGALGMLIHVLCFRGIAARAPNVDVFEARSLMVGFGLMFAVQNAALIVWGGDLRGYEYLAQPVELAGMRFTENKLVIFAVALALSLGFVALLKFTLLGKAVRALMQSPTGAQLVGINTKRLQLLSMTYEISPSMGEPYTVTALIVITLGGFGSVAGSLVGGLLLGLVEALGMYFTSPSLKMLLSYAVFIGVLIWRPNGLFSR